ncbi:hypothetical protein JGH11_04680 [Dysgonomonas sp. Marseille-P4677]|uniref:hypothetical protein n=1 Tax=Dysgonomonas sp. Marseille-P4677 TaxID=2364790 RepID=UPI0019147EFC|nr:hypothetical protein [Dysgonomonas sp. Marseille-P4677]MBK5720162.1 hypothetical protein [Dysgonomonas sp. Marseille-P4677]
MKNTFILSILFFLFSCNNNELEFEKEYVIQIESYYKIENNELLFADTNTDIFVYYGIYTSDIAGYIIDKNGILTIGDKNIYPNKHHKISNTGKCEFISEQPNDKITLLIISNNYKDKISQFSYPNTKSDIKIEVVVNP